MRDADLRDGCICRPVDCQRENTGTAEHSERSRRLPPGHPRTVEVEPMPRMTRITLQQVPSTFYPR
jgi:hypothetical protein